mgnify:CR=1 FL=1
MPLTMAGIGETNTISRIGGNEETRRFLANLGFVAGAEVVVLSTTLFHFIDYFFSISFFFRLPVVTNYVILNSMLTYKGRNNLL